MKYFLITVFILVGIMSIYGIIEDIKKLRDQINFIKKYRKK